MTIAQSTLPSAGRGSEDEGREIRELVGHFFKYTWLILGAAIIGCGIAYFWTTRQPRIYEADCTLEFDSNPTRPLGKAVEDVSEPMQFWQSREYFATQNKIISSRNVAEKVVRKLGLHMNADFLGVPVEARATWKGQDVTDAAAVLQSKTTVTSERDTRIVHVVIRDTEPQRATTLANAIVDAYIEKTMEDRLSSTTGALEWLGKQLDSLKQRLEQSELALHDFTGEHTTLAVSLDDQKNIVASDVELLSRTLTEQKTKHIELAARLKELKATNSSDPFAVHAPTITSSAAVISLRQRHKELEAERGALAVHYGDSHPKLLAADAEMSAAREQLRKEIDGIIAGAESDLREASSVESGVRQALADANRVGLALNLQEITFRRLQRERDNTGKLYGTLLERTTETDLTHALQVSYVRVVDRALVPGFAVSPRVQLTTIVGALLGIVLGVGLSFLLARLDRVIRTVEDAEAFGLTILGIMPRIEEGGSVPGPTYGRKKRREAPERITNRDMIVHSHPKSSVAECCRTIRTNLTFMSADTSHRTLVITSANPREGKTTVTMSLAISLAQSGKRVLIVDTDLRKPRIHRALGRSAGRGVTSILVGEHNIKEAVQETEVPGLYFLASGPIPPNPSELLHTVQFSNLIRDLAREYDQVIFDSPPLAAVTDAAIIAPQVDGAMLVIHGQKTTRDALRSSLRQLRDVKCNLTGGVLNDVDLSSRQYGYSTYYHYHREGYYEDPADSDDKPEPKRPVAQA